MISWIQNHVLLELTQNATRRYSQLRPRDVESNLFLYHLKGLVREGMVEKSDNVYKLTSKGMHFADTLSLKTGKTRQQPKILTAVVCKNDAGEHLLVKWHRQPNIDQVSFPHGLVHFGESIFDMAALELAEKAGLSAELSHIGEVYVLGAQNGVVERHMLVHLFEAQNPQPDQHLAIRPEISESFWAPLTSISPKNFVPGFYEIAQLALTEPSPFFKEITVTIGDAL